MGPQIKHKAINTTEKYKVGLMAKGYTQQEGIDCKETFSPVVWFTSTYLILAIIASIGLELHHVDVKTAFLNGDVE